MYIYIYICIITKCPRIHTCIPECQSNHFLVVFDIQHVAIFSFLDVHAIAPYVLCLCVCLYVCVCAYLRVRVYMYMSARSHLQFPRGPYHCPICIVSLHVFSLYVCMYMYMYIYIYIYI